MSALQVEVVAQLCRACKYKQVMSAIYAHRDAAYARKKRLVVVYVFNAVLWGVLAIE
mgnify:CR=1 FL=1